ncbi:MAG: hypothetical protein IIB56_16560 [Planctomycetes bacterium]|nr:hypothetical protein [Planctomycetota bacterium]
MRNKTYMWLTVGVSLLILTSPAPAQDEQWLQYHSEREAQRIVGDMGTSNPKVVSEEPEGVELPDFKCDDPFFACWSTPMVESGQLWIALDRTQKQGQWDRLFIDSNGNGHLNDETAITAYRTDRYYTYFGPVKVVFQGEDGPITYHLNFRFYNHNERSKRLYVYSGGWYEGTITIAGAKKHCVLIDQNANGTFDDKSLEAHKCDRIRIGKKGSLDTGYVGNYIEVDSTLYRTEIARDGAYIKLTKAEDVKFGNLRLPETITEFSAGGENGLFTLKPEKGTGSLPVGRYRVNYWAIEREDERGKKWKLRSSVFSRKSDFEITADKEAELSIGEPIISTLEATKSGSGYSFSQNLQGRLGEHIELTRNGSRPPAPKLHIKSEDGSYDRTFSFEYG